MQYNNNDYILKLKRKWWFLAWFCFIIPLIVIPIVIIILTLLHPDSLLIFMLIFGFPLAVCVTVFCEGGSAIRKKLISLGHDVTLRFPKK